MRISVIIPNFNGREFLGACLDSLLRQTRPAERVMVVDNGSSDGSRELAERHPLRPELIALHKNLGFAAAVNRGIEAADSEAIALLNNDAVCDRRWLEKGLAAMSRHPGVSSFASLVLQYHDRDLVDSAGDFFPPEGRPAHRGQGEKAASYQEPALVLSAPAAAAFYRRALFEQVGAFEEGFFAYLEDVDLGIRAQCRGRACLVVPEAVVYHLGAATALSDRAGKKSVDSSERVFLIARNRVRVLARSFPRPWLIRLSPWLALGFLKSAAYHLAVSRQGTAFLRGLGRGIGGFANDRRFFRKQALGGGGNSASASPGWSFAPVARLIREGEMKCR